MAVRVQAVLKVAIVFFRSFSYIPQASSVHAVPLVGDRKDACALRYASIRRFEG